jgi:formate hydrogenlyase transcriptional activator
VECHDDPVCADLVRRSTEPAVVLDPLEDRFLVANGPACTMLGYTLEELLETRVSEIHAGELAQLREVVDDVLRRGHGSTIGLTCRKKTGECLPMEMMLWACRSGDGRSVLALMQDRSEHRAPRS